MIRPRVSVPCLGVLTMPPAAPSKGFTYDYARSPPWQGMVTFGNVFFGLALLSTIILSIVLGFFFTTGMSPDLAIPVISSLVTSVISSLAFGTLFSAVARIEQRIVEGIDAPEREAARKEVFRQAERDAYRDRPRSQFPE